MSTIQVLDSQIINGAAKSRFVTFANLECHEFRGVASFVGNATDPLADPNFGFVLKVIAELSPHTPQVVAVYEYPLGQMLSVAWTGIARRVWLEISTSKLVTASLSLTY